MKRFGGLFDAIVSWDNLRLAYYKASKGKHLKAAVVAFGLELDKNLEQVRRTLNDPDLAGIGWYAFFGT